MTSENTEEKKKSWMGVFLLSWPGQACLVAVLSAIVAGAYFHGGGHQPVSVIGLDLVLLIVMGTLLSVAILHNHGKEVAWTGMCLATAYTFYKGSISVGGEAFSLTHHLHHEFAEILLELILLLYGYAFLAKLFELSRIGELLPAVLEDDVRGARRLLLLVWTGSQALDNIAAALIGGKAAKVVFPKVCVGFVVALATLANAGGSHSPIGDTTTIMMVIAKIPSIEILKTAGVASVLSGLIVSHFASKQQDAFSRIRKDPVGNITVDGRKIFAIVICILLTIGANALWAHPAIGLISGIVLTLPLAIRSWKDAKDLWHETSGSTRQTMFISSLVLMASVVPVKDLMPEAGTGLTFGLGYASAGFDNIPLTKVCIMIGGFVWGLLAFSVGYGGSMTNFGSTAGVAICGKDHFPDADSTGRWIREGWHVWLAFPIAFGVQWLVSLLPDPIPLASAVTAVSGLSLYSTWPILRIICRSIKKKLLGGTPGSSPDTVSN